MQASSSSSLVPTLPTVHLLSYAGTESEDVLNFIENIQVTAFTQGREQDDTWQAQLAASCLDGSALRWLSLQDDLTQSSWTALKQALIAAFPRTRSGKLPVGRDTPSRSANTTPWSSATTLSLPTSTTRYNTPPLPTASSSSAPSPSFFYQQLSFPPKRPSRLSPSTAALVPKLPTRKGRIRVLKGEANAFCGYLPRKIAGNASYAAGLAHAADEDVLVVGVPFRSFLNDFRWKVAIANSSGDTDPSNSKPMHLDITRLGIRSLKQYCLYSSPVDGGGDESSSTGTGGWTMKLHIDGTEELQPSWNKNDKSSTLYLNHHAHRKGAVRLWFTVIEDPDTSARLVFEPM